MRGSAVAASPAAPRVPDPVVRKLRATAGGYARRGNHEAAAATRHQLDFHQLAEHARKVVDTWGPLTDEQYDRLSLLLRPGAKVTADAS